MASEARDRDDANLISRRVLIKSTGVAAGAIALGSRFAVAQTPSPMAPPSTITTPPRDFGPNAPPNVYFTDPDVLTIDPLFNSLRQPNAPLRDNAQPRLFQAGIDLPGQVPTRRIGFDDRQRPLGRHWRAPGQRQMGGLTRQSGARGQGRTRSPSSALSPATPGPTAPQVPR